VARLLAATSHVHVVTFGNWELSGFCDVLWVNFHSLLCDSGAVASQLDVTHTYTHTHTQTQQGDPVSLFF
jgi:hypothetical protein